jgi:hypothetical protein
MTTITQTITTLTDPPDPATDQGDTYSDKAALTMTELNTALGQMNTWAGQANTVAGEVNTNATTATTQASNASASAAASEASSVVSAAAANYVGLYSALTGAKSAGISAEHIGALWLLNAASADITADVPGTSGKWTRMFGTGQINARTSNIKFVAEDNGKIFEYTSGTFSQTLDPAATLKAGWSIYVRNSGTGIITLDPDSSELINGAATYTLNKGSTVLIICTGTAFSAIAFAEPVGDHSVVVNTGNGHGSTNNCIRRFTTTVSSSGTAITYADSATLGASFTINETGLYAIEYSDAGAVGVQAEFGISKNSAQLTTSILSITTANRLGMASTYDQPGVAVNTPFTVVRRLEASDVIRPHTNGALTTALTARNYFSITKIGV